MTRDKRTTREKGKRMTAWHLQKRGKIGDRNLSVRNILHTTYSGDENFFPPHVKARRKVSPGCLGTHLGKLSPSFFTLTFLKKAPTQRWRDRKCYFPSFGKSLASAATPPLSGNFLCLSSNPLQYFIALTLSPYWKLDSDVNPLGGGIRKFLQILALVIPRTHYFSQPPSTQICHFALSI